MPFTPGPYSGVSTLALVARASALGVGVVYGAVKLSILKGLRIETGSSGPVRRVICSNKTSQKGGGTCASLRTGTLNTF
uniref:ATP synthase subunit e, mitochondrial n=1 Tax=Oryza punctata TaxID=4537 RepID=A0A0E0KM88_ORYPU